VIPASHDNEAKNAIFFQRLVLILHPKIIGEICASVDLITDLSLSCKGSTFFYCVNWFILNFLGSVYKVLAIVIGVDNRICVNYIN